MKSKILLIGFLLGFMTCKSDGDKLKPEELYAKWKLSKTILAYKAAINEMAMFNVNNFTKAGKNYDFDEIVELSSKLSDNDAKISAGLLDKELAAIGYAKCVKNVIDTKLAARKANPEILTHRDEFVKFLAGLEGVTGDDVLKIIANKK